MNMIRHTLLALAVGSVFIAMPKAHAATSGSFSGFMNKITGKTGTVGVGTGGVPVITTPTRELVAGGGWAQAGNFGVAGGAQAADGFVLGGKGSMTIGGKSVEYAGRASISKESLAGAVVSCLTGGIVGCTVAAIPLALEWLGNAGGRVDPATGALQKKDPEVCTVAPCYEYKIDIGPRQVGWAPLAEVCTQLAEAMQAVNGPGPGWTYSTSVAATGTACNYQGTGADNGWHRGSIAASQRSRPPSAETWLPASMDDIAPYLQRTAVSPAVVKELADAGVPVEQLQPGEQADPVNRPAIAISPWVIDGPSEVIGPKVDTVQSDGKKITSQEKTGYTYNGDKITQGPTTTTTTTTTTNPDGTTSTSTDTTTTTKGEDTPDDTPSDTPLPDLPKLYQRKYPDGIVGIWNTKSEQIKQAPLLHVASDLMPNVGSGGSCPTFTIPLDFAQWASYGSSDVSPPCWIWDFGKAVVIVSAMLLARALVFGG